MSRWPQSYGLVPDTGTLDPRTIGSCPYWGPPTEYERYFPQPRHQLLRQRQSILLTFSARSAYSDGETLTVDATWHARSSANVWDGSSAVRKLLRRFEIGVTPGHTPAPGYVLLDLSGATTATQVRDATRAVLLLAARACFACESVSTTQLRLRGLYPGSGANGLDGTSFGTGKTSRSWETTGNLQHTLVAIGGRGAFLGPFIDVELGGNGAIREGEFAFGHSSL